MIKIPVDELETGREVAVDVKIHSRHPGSLYRLKIDEGTILQSKHIKRLEKAGVSYVFVRDDRTEDLDDKIYDRDLDKAEDEVLETLDEIQLSVKSNDVSTISTEQLNNAIDNIIGQLRKTKAMEIFHTLKSHHDYTVKHSLEVTKLALHMVLSRQREIHEKLLDETAATPSYTMKYMVKDLGLGAILHDIGKWRIPRDVLEKKGELDLQEWNAVKKHPGHGRDILEKINENFRSPVLAPVKSHHEKYGGEGYPEGKLGDQIHLYGRILACCDVFSALTSRRPYRVALTPNRAIQTMQDMQRDDVHFDPGIFKLFQELVPPFPIGQKVVLNDGSMGVVSELGDDWQQPTVRILKETDKKLDEPYEITVNTGDAPKIVN